MRGYVTPPLLFMTSVKIYAYPTKWNILMSFYIDYPQNYCGRQIPRNFYEVVFFGLRIWEFNVWEIGGGNSKIGIVIFGKGRPYVSIGVTLKGRTSKTYFLKKYWLCQYTLFINWVASNSKSSKLPVRQTGRVPTNLLCWSRLGHGNLLFLFRILNKITMSFCYLLSIKTTWNWILMK